MEGIWDRLWNSAAGRRLYERAVGELLPDLVAAIVTFALIFLIWRLISRALATVARKTSLDPTATNFIQQTGRFVATAIGLVAALGQLGVNTASLLTSLGVAGLTIGFAARDALSNIIAGVFIFLDRPFSMGDLIEVSGNYGKVAEITMRSTRVVTTDGRMLAVPNTEIVNSTVASYTNFPHLRIEIDATIGTGEDIGRVRRLLTELVAGDERFMREPPPELVVTGLNDYNTAVQFRVWIEDERGHLATRFELRERVFETLRSAGVDMPLETLKLEPLQVLSA